MFSSLNVFHIPCINQIQKYINNLQIHFNIYDAFYSRYSHQHVSAGIPAIFKVMLLLKEYSYGLLRCRHSIIIQLI